MSACNSSKTKSAGTYKVTVVSNEGFDQLVGHYKVIAVTESGDSVTSIISEGLLFNNTIPFQAEMKKNQIARYGRIDDSSSNNMFEVTVIGQAERDFAMGGHKVVVKTKSGMEVDCHIKNEVLLKNKIPFSTLMKKNEIARFGFIN